MALAKYAPPNQNRQKTSFPALLEWDIIANIGDIYGMIDHTLQSCVIKIIIKI